MNNVIRIEASHFVAAIVTNEENVVVDAAPILKWTIGKDGHECLKYFESKGYLITTLHPKERE